MRSPVIQRRAIGLIGASFLFSFFISQAAWAQSAVTRSVALYMDLERDLDAALIKSNTAFIAKTLAKEFENRTPVAAYRGIDDWLNSERLPSGLPHELAELHVKETGGVATVSFLRWSPATPNAIEFVVDVWRQSDHKLLIRYTSPSGLRAPPERRPTGRG